MATAEEILKEVTALLQDRGLKIRELSDETIDTLDISQAIININMMLSLFSASEVSAILNGIDYCRDCGLIMCHRSCVRYD